MYQSGYLTITGYDEVRECYILGFPNEEVRRGFIKDLSTRIPKDKGRWPI